MEEYIEELFKKAAEASSPEAAVAFSQAAKNAVDAMYTLELLKQSKQPQEPQYS